MNILIEKHNKTGRMGRYAIIELDLLSKKTKVEFYNKKL